MEYKRSKELNGLDRATKHFESSLLGYIEVKDSFNLKGARFQGIELEAFEPVPGTWCGALLDGSGVSIWKMAPGVVFMVDGEPDYHEKTKEVFFLIEGEGHWHLNGRARPVKAPAITVVNEKTRHHFESTSWCWLVCKQIPPDAFTVVTV